MARNKIQIINEEEKSRALKNSKKKLKTSIEEVFGRTKRLPVFSDITLNNSDHDNAKKMSSNIPKNKLRVKKHRFLKQNSEQI